MTLSPDGKWAFVTYWQTSSGGAHIHTYSIDSSTGAWSGPIVSTGSPVAFGGQTPQAGPQPTDIHLTVDPTSSYLFAANPYQNLVFAFRIGNDGSLTTVGNVNGTSPPGTAPFSLAATATAVYFGDFNTASIYGFNFSSNGLMLTPGAPYHNAGAPAYNMTLDPTHRLLYVVDNDPSAITVWKIGADGSLSEVPGSPFMSPEQFGNNPSYMVLQ